MQWSSDSPLASRLEVNVPFELLADYSTASGQVTGKLLAGCRPNQKRSLSFELPRTLDPVPLGEICLYIRRAGEAYPLPIRTAGGSLGTAGFRYSDWEGIVKTNSRRAALEMERAKLQSRISEVRKTKQRLLAKNEYSNEGDCEAIQVSVNLEKPPSVVDKDQHPTVTKKICVRRLINTADFEGLKNEAQLLSFIEKFLTDLPRKRTGQFDTLLGDWQGVRHLIGTGYVPELGTPREILPRPKRYLNKKDNGKAYYMELAAGLLDAYFICREDIPKQLVDELEAWTQAQRMGSQRHLRALEYARRECRKQIATLSSVSAQLDVMTARKLELDTEINKLMNTPVTHATGADLQLDACRRE